MGTSEKPIDRERVRAAVLDLAPWYFDIEVKDELRTSLYLDAPQRPGTTRVLVRILDSVDGTASLTEAFVPAEHASQAEPHVPFLNPRDEFLKTLRSVYPDGLQGRSVLDCACNSGAYLFWAKEAGAGRCFGFDLREHWIKQARFLSENRDGPTEDMRFEVSDLYDLPALELEHFDVVLFNGIFYHLPDPIAGLRIAADLAEEILILDTAARRGYSEGALVATVQPGRNISTGVYGLRWLPLGPKALFRLLEWMGFAETHCTWWRPRTPIRDRIEIVAGRRPGSLEALDATWRTVEDRIRSIVATSVPPDTDVLVASGGNDALLELEARRGWHFPQSPDGAHAPDHFDDANTAIAHLEALREAGAGYLAVPLDVPSGLEAIPDFMDLARKRFRVVRRGPTCRIFQLIERERPPFRPQGD